MVENKDQAINKVIKVAQDTPTHTRRTFVKYVLGNTTIIFTPILSLDTLQKIL